MRWKAVLAGVVALVVVLMVGLYVVVSTYDYDKLIPGLFK
jgi:flagellar biosynthesis/type III secretory pathway M-ring protein FliF/YscJ